MGALNGTNTGKVTLTSSTGVITDHGHVSLDMNAIKDNLDIGDIVERLRNMELEVWRMKKKCEQCKKEEENGKTN